MFTSNHFTDSKGRPAGGSTYGRGFAIAWQNGPLVDPKTGQRGEPNGAFVEDVIQAAIDRLEFYQRGPFACEANAVAITYLRSAIVQLNIRTADRERRNVEGTHEV